MIKEIRKFKIKTLHSNSFKSKKYLSMYIDKRSDFIDRYQYENKSPNGLANYYFPNFLFEIQILRSKKALIHIHILLRKTFPREKTVVF